MHTRAATIQNTGSSRNVTTERVLREGKLRDHPSAVAGSWPFPFSQTVLPIIRRA
jgi:hypothetical protein